MSKTKKGRAVSRRAPDVRVVPLSRFRLDAQNANLHTARARALLEQSLAARKFARPVFASGDGTILAGNLTVESAQAVGMDEAIVIETDGSRPVIHVRKDLKADDPAARQLALDDNRIAELSLTWDYERLAELAAQSPELLASWNEQELRAVLAQAPEKVEFKEYDESLEGQVKTVKCPNCGTTIPL